MAQSIADLVQGEVEGFPTKRSQMKHRLSQHYHHEALFRFTLVLDGVEQEVEMVKEGGHGTPGDGSWYTELFVCPVKTLNTKRGTRLVHVEVDPDGHATFL